MFPIKVNVAYLKDPKIESIHESDVKWTMFYTGLSGTRSIRPAIPKMSEESKNMEMTMKAITVVAAMFLALFCVSSVFAEKGPEYNKALQYYDSGNYKEAVRLFQDYVKKKPDAAAYYRIGYGLYKLEKYHEAEENFKQAYLIDPSFSPGPAGTPQKYPEKKIKKTKKTSAKRVFSEKQAPISESKGKQPETKPQAIPEKAPSKEVGSQKPR